MLNDRNKANGDCLWCFCVPEGIFGNILDIHIVFVVESFSGGEIFPFGGLVAELIDVVAGFEIFVPWGELAVVDNATTDSGREG